MIKPEDLPSKVEAAALSLESEIDKLAKQKFSSEGGEGSIEIRNDFWTDSRVLDLVNSKYEKHWKFVKIYTYCPLDDEDDLRVYVVLRS